MTDQCTNCLRPIRCSEYCETCERCVVCCVCTIEPDIDIDDTKMLTMYGEPGGFERLENPDHEAGVNQ